MSHPRSFRLGLVQASLVVWLSSAPFAMGFNIHPHIQQRNHHFRRRTENPTQPIVRGPLALHASTTNNSLDHPNTEQSKHEQPSILQQWLVDTVWFRAFVQYLARLSLADYHWRSNLFKTNQADRMVQDALARLQGDSPPTYVRPMDASSLGPLGTWERDAVAWLGSVMDEEGRRAQRMVDANGTLVRPSDNTEPLGPLGRFEGRVVDCVAQIQRAEAERVRTQTWRPKDLEEASRGPLGQLEYEAVQTFEEIRVSETLRGRQIRQRGGEWVRPIDIPGPLGELELQMTQVIQAERRRFRERLRNDGRLVRPKDATWQGPLGEAEATAYAAMQSVSTEEMERLRNIQRSLLENRPMETNRSSLLGVTEALVVGLWRGPALVWEVWTRVRELLSSTPLDESDQDRLRRGKPNESTQQSSGNDV